MASCSALLLFRRNRSFLSPLTSLSSHFSSAAAFSSPCKQPRFTLPEQSPPLAKKVPFKVSAHGRTWEDLYRWMSNTNDPDFVQYLQEENAYAEAFMADTVDLQNRLVSEMRSRLPTNISTPPERWGPWLYYQCIPEGKEFPVLYRRLEPDKVGWAASVLNYVRGQTGREEILLDWNEVAERYVHVGTCRVSPDHRFLAYTLDTTGSEWFNLQVKDLRTGCILPNLQAEGVVSLAWAQDSRTLFYTLADKNQRPYSVLCANIGASNNSDDTVVFTESDSRFCVDITATKDGKFITVYLIDAMNPLGQLRKILKRMSDVQLFVEHHDEFFYVLTNAPLSQSVEWSGEGYYLARCLFDNIELAKFQDVVLPGEDMSFQDMDVFSGYLVLSICKEGLPMLCSISLPFNLDRKAPVELKELNPWFFPMPSKLCTILPGSNHDFMNPVYRAVLSSPVMPDVIVDYDLSRRKVSTVHQEEVLCASVLSGLTSSDDAEKPVDPLASKKSNNTDIQEVEMQRWKSVSESYCCERKEVISYDGVRIPLTILYSKEAWRQGQSPGLLHGYGAYGEVLDISWCPNRLSLLDRGWLLAFADVRGGGGSDSSWHKSGRGFDKENSIHDFAACGKYLVKEGLIHQDQLCAIGYSAGCILMGAAINMYSDLFRAVILKVPFLDICNTLLDPTLPLTTLDYEEFGNPQMLPQFETMMRYSPYDNIPSGGCHPSTLVTASFLDSRVGVWEAAKWVAKVRDYRCSSCSRSVILRTDMAAGHFSEGGYSQHIEETAYDYAFLMKVLCNHLVLQTQLNFIAN
ncbi:hypothetical protein CDL15_Pgr024186 [Punica granatum]|uniref:Prolyl endopeptidase n=1 Tax=Punica granatum TaxID=22663 RepID=A0A218XXF1_PUNGR|nr:hypothetical protein CDL15_Pgr024186 [Punica granatum]